LPDEIKLGIAQHNGIRAQELLDNSLLQETLKYLEETYLQAWRSTKVKDTESRERLWQAIQILGIIQEHLKLYVVNGKVAAGDLRRLSAEAQRKTK
jgi:hypothetical protein